MLRTILILLLLLIGAPLGYFIIVSHLQADLQSLPELESGDLILDTTLTHQTAATVIATGSIYTHIGIIHKQPSGTTVIQAARTVVETPITEFIQNGWGERFTLLRYKDLTEEQRSAIIKNAQSYLGRPYNYTFYMPSKEIYCSELAYLSFNTLHLPLGKLEKISDLHVNNSAVHSLFERRWKMHPACQKPGMDYEACWQQVLNEPIITPAGIASDPHLIRIYSNYLF